MKHFNVSGKIAQKKHYVMSDVHGCGGLFDSVMKFLEEQEGGYQLIFLGDAIDRGTHGYRIMKSLLNNPNVIYLKGNHEDMFLRAVHEFKDYCAEEGLTPRQLYDSFGRDTRAMLEHVGDECRLYAYNGGTLTFESWINDRCSNIVYKIKDLPLTHSYDKFDFCHAGCTVYNFEKNDESCILWDRTHFPAPWAKDRVLIHGHTPVQHLFRATRHHEAIDEEAPKYLQPVRYSGNKIDMDTATYFTGVLSVYCLEDDNFTVISSSDTLPLFEKY